MSVPSKIRHKKTLTMRKLSIAIIGLFLLIYILPLGIRPITIPDESRYAEIPREMIASGDWVVPHLNGLRYFEKPVLGYWLNAISITLLGENNFAIRLPSAIAAAISGLMLLLLVRKYGGGYSAGILASSIFLTSLLVFGIATINLLDTMLSTFLTGAMVLFFLGYMEAKPRRRTLFLALSGTSCGLAFLVKGFLAFVVLAIVIVPFTLWEGQWKEILKRSWVSILAVILVVMPWAVTIHLREGDYWNYFFWTEHIKRFVMPIKGQHPKPFWYFFPVIIGGALPWMALLPAAVSGLGKKGLRDPLPRFAICWFLFPFLFFSVSRGKLVPYILPCFPPVAIFISIGLLEYFRAGKQRAFTIGAFFLGVMIGFVGVALIFSNTFCLPALELYGHGETWKWVIAIIGLLTWSILSLLATRGKDYWRRIAIYSFAPLLFMFSSQIVIPVRIMEGRAPGRLLIRNAHWISPETILVSDHQVVSAVCWFYKRDDVHLLDDYGELSYGLSHDNSKSHRSLLLGGFIDLIGNKSREKKVVLIMKTGRFAKYKDFLPAPLFQDVNSGFVFNQF